jgi:cyclase
MLCRGRTLVKGRGFAGDRSVGHVLQAARIHSRRQVDELCLLDIAATREGRGPDLDMVRELTETIFTPVTVGGGVRSLQDIDDLLRAGADKVCIGSAFDIIPEAAARFGRQAIVASLDCRAPTSMDTVVVRAVSMAHLGAGEILLQSVDRDGTMTGYDLDLIREVSEAVDIPVIASGGCSGPEDALAAIRAGADAVAIGALFLFTDHTPRSVSRYLRDNGVEVRL